MAESFEAWTGARFTGELGNISAPTLVVATDDPFLPPAFLRQAVVEPIARARLAVLPGPGHYLPVEQPAQTAALLDAFCAGGVGTD
jgi:pimeloyl-ACP methyl ester carboxylesterase